MHEDNVVRCANIMTGLKGAGPHIKTGTAIWISPAKNWNPYMNKTEGDDRMIWYPYEQMKTMKAPYKIVDAEGVYLHTEDRRADRFRIFLVERDPWLQASGAERERSRNSCRNLLTSCWEV